LVLQEQRFNGTQAPPRQPISHTRWLNETPCLFGSLPKFVVKSKEEETTLCFRPSEGRA